MYAKVKIGFVIYHVNVIMIMISIFDLYYNMFLEGGLFIVSNFLG